MVFEDNADAVLSDLVVSLQTLLLGSHDLATFLEGVATVAEDVVEAPAACGITLLLDGRDWTGASSDPRAAEADRVQHTYGTGPCVEAATTGEVVEVGNQARDHRWPSYAEHARALGVRHSLSVPLRLEGRTRGSLNVYHYDHPRVPEDERRRMELFAARASTAISLALQRTEHQDLSHHLERALRARSVIDQAIGVLMAHERCGADAAFDMLRRHSQNSNRKLRDVAADVITRVTGHPPGAHSPFATRDRVTSERSP